MFQPPALWKKRFLALLQPIKNPSITQKLIALALDILITTNKEFWSRSHYFVSEHALHSATPELMILLLNATSFK